MIKHLYRQFIKKWKNYRITAIVLFLSFFVVSSLLSVVHSYFIKSFSPRLAIDPENRVELYIDWKRDVVKNNNQLKREQLKHAISKIEGVEASAYVVNDLFNYTTFHSYEHYSNNAYLFFCDENFNTVFDLTMDQGSWSSDMEKTNELPAVIITKNNADYLGIKTLSPQTTYKLKNFDGRKKDSMIYQVTGIVDNLANMRSQTGIEENLFPIFISMNDPHYIKNGYQSLIQRLMLKMNDGYSFQKLNNEILGLMEKYKFNDAIYKHQLISLDDVLQIQKKNHFIEYKIIYGILFILMSYIFIVLFGNFWKITSRRTIEIGIRRALGHSLLRVVFYIVSESVLLFGIVMCPITLVYINLYKTINVKSPISIYLVSAGLLFIVILIATLLPAIRASHIHPVEALAEE